MDIVDRLRAAGGFIDSTDIAAADLADAIEGLRLQVEVSENQRRQILHTINFHKGCNREANQARAEAERYRTALLRITRMVDFEKMAEVASMALAAAEPKP